MFVKVKGYISDKPGEFHTIDTERTDLEDKNGRLKKALSKKPEQFGKGAVAGVAGPETANNATTGAAMIPLLTLGIPAIPVNAVLLAALSVHNVTPGPLLVTEHPDIFWGLIASMFIGNVILVILNLPLVGLFVSILRTPIAYLAPLVMLACVLGVYSMKGSVFDLAVMLTAGVVGYFLRKADYDLTPFLLAFVLGDRIEISFRRALLISDGDWMIFTQGPAARVFLAMFAIIVTGMAAAAVTRRRRKLAP